MKRQTSMAGEYTFGRGREWIAVSFLERRTRGEGTFERTGKSRGFRFAELGPRPDIRKPLGGIRKAVAVRFYQLLGEDGTHSQEVMTNRLRWILVVQGRKVE